MGLTVLDAGVVIAGLDANDAHHAAASAALATAQRQRDRLVVPAAAYAETIVRPAGHGAAVVARVDEALDALGVAIAPIDREIARTAAVLRSKHKSLRLPDALVIAAAIELDAYHLLTTDQRWRSLRGLGMPARLAVIR
jgi:predicted nucleic acid-binding protein